MFLGKCSEQTFLKTSLIPKRLIFLNDLTLYFSSIQMFSMTLDLTTISVFCSICEKCPNTEYFLVRIFLHSD